MRRLNRPLQLIALIVAAGLALLLGALALTVYLDSASRFAQLS